MAFTELNVTTTTPTVYIMHQFYRVPVPPRQAGSRYHGQYVVLRRDVTAAGFCLGILHANTFGQVQNMQVPVMVEMGLLLVVGS